MGSKLLEVPEDSFSQELSMDTSERTARGADLLVKMLGEDSAEKVRAGWRAICPEFESYVVEFLAGEIWSRPALDLRARSLVTIAALAALGRTRGLELNLRMALNNGVSKQEIIETLLHIAPYAGFPAAWEGLALAHDVFARAGVSE
jgi:4-carboxymuconolactone decarboxylase